MKIFANENCSIAYPSTFSLIAHDQLILWNTKCQAVEREEKDWEREVLRDTERFWEITFKVSPSQPSEDWHDEVVSRESLPSSTRKPEVFLSPSSSQLLRTLSLTLNTLDARPSLLLMLSMPSRDKVALSTVSVVNLTIRSPIQERSISPGVLNAILIVTLQYRLIFKHNVSDVFKVYINVKGSW